MKIVWERKQPKQQCMALIAMDWYNFSMGFLLIIGGFLMIADRVTRKDFQMTFGNGQWISAGVILIVVGCAMVIKCVGQ